MPACFGMAGVYVLALPVGPVPAAGEVFPIPLKMAQYQASNVFVPVLVDTT